MAFKGSEEVSWGWEPCPLGHFCWCEPGIKQQLRSMAQAQISQIFDWSNSKGGPEMSEQGAARHGGESSQLIKINFTLEILLEEICQFRNVQGDIQDSFCLGLPGIAEQAKQSHEESQLIAVIAGLVTIAGNPEGKSLEFGKNRLIRRKTGEIPFAVM